MNAKTYNKLTIIKDTGKRTKSGNALYECQCDCGNTCETTLAKLRSGHTKSCGCLIKDTANEKFKKYVGMRNNRLTLISDTGKRTSVGQRIVLCKCDCGNTCEVVFAKFNSGHSKSCGCLALEKKKEKHEEGRAEKATKTLQDKKILIDGTNVAVINSNKIRSNNTTGNTGVTFDNSRKKWVAQLVFQDRHYTLGRFTKKEDAIKARIEAEEKYFKPIIEKSKERDRMSRKAKLDMNELQEYINENPDKSAKDIAEHFEVSATAIHYHIKKYNLSYKKKKRITSIDQREFEDFVKTNSTLSINELAEFYNVTVGAIQEHLNIMHKKTSSKINIDELQKYITNNPESSLDELSRHFNISSRRMRSITKAYNIDYKRKNPNPLKLNVDELRAFIIENPDLNRQDIAKDFNVSVGTIDNYIKKYDLPYKPKPGRKKKTFRN
ncbi:TPA: hypothetical protein RET50_000874 [Listeria monocytogenes]|nr:hypothetical protein [Listeria monocytogenes]